MSLRNIYIGVPKRSHNKTIYEQEWIICVMPVVVYPKGYIEKMLKDVEEIKQKMAAVEQPVFDTVRKLIAGLESED